jgi:hypothetical protein
MSSKRPAELHHPAFLRMNAQPKPLESLGQDPIDGLGLSFHAKTHDEVIGVPHQKTGSFNPWTDHGVEPLVQDGMQKHVRQNW